MHSLFGAVMMLIGENSSPRDVGQQLFASSLTLFGTFVTSIIIGTCASLISSMGMQAAEKQVGPPLRAWMKSANSGRTPPFVRGTNPPSWQRPAPPLFSP